MNIRSNELTISSFSQFQIVLIVALKKTFLQSHAGRNNRRKEIQPDKEKKIKVKTKKKSLKKESSTKRRIKKKIPEKKAKKKFARKERHKKDQKKRRKKEK